MVVIGLMPAVVCGQNIISEMDHDAHRVYDRMTILTGGVGTDFHTAIKPFWRSDVVRLADTFYAYAVDPIDRFHAQTIWDQNNEFILRSSGADDPRYRVSRNPLWNTFYQTPAHLYEVNVPDFYLRVNPLLHFGVGKESEESATTFINQRGVSIRGGIGPSVYFHTELFDSQARFPNYVNRFTDSIGVVPGAGLYKNPNSSFLGTTQSRDYLLARAFVGFDLGKYFDLQLGHNQHFIGDGVRSLFLSDFATPYFSLRINTRIWKLHYHNIFAELSADDFRSVNGQSEPVSKKYLAAHYLSFKPSPAVSIGLFESVVFDREDHRFELQYLNPIILYRAVEGTIGSPDNVMLGLTARVDVRKTISMYGQFVLDDIQIREILDGNLDSWSNKFGYQLGINYINALGVRHLDLQLERNEVRPYTYSHYNKNSNYSHYRQALAHPVGANFKEWLGRVNYAFSKKLTGELGFHLIMHGEDMDSVSFGGNILVPNTQRPGDFGITLGQGVDTDLFIAFVGLHYHLSPGVFIDAEWFYRDKQSELPERDLKTNEFRIAVRWNMFRRQNIF